MRFAVLIFAVALTGCAGRRYATSTDRKSDAEPIWYKTLCPGSIHLPLCWCVDRSDGTHCKPE